MHCDDKRTLFVLKKMDFSNEDLINKLSEEIQEYFEYKNSPTS